MQRQLDRSHLLCSSSCGNNSWQSTSHKRGRTAKRQLNSGTSRIGKCHDVQVHSPLCPRNHGVGLFGLFTEKITPAVGCPRFIALETVLVPTGWACHVIATAVFVPWCLAIRTRLQVVESEHLKHIQNELVTEKILTRPLQSSAHANKNKVNLQGQSLTLAFAKFRAKRPELLLKASST